MAVYDYMAKDENGDTLTGTYGDVDNVATLRQDLAKMGYALIKARRHKKPRRTSRRIKQREVVTFMYQFAEMYSAGLSITSCLEVLEQQSHNPAFARIVADVRQNIESGSSLKKAFENYKDVFSNFFTGMVEAGESGGRLSEALERSATYLEKRLDIRHQIKAACTYPIVAGLLCFVVIGCLVVFVVPVFSKLYRQLRIQLPGPTQALVSLGFVIRDYWWAIPFIVGGIAMIVYRLCKNPQVKAMWDTFKLNMPIFGKLNRMIVVTHFTRTFGMLTSVGVSPIDALEVASAVAHNHKLTEIAKDLQESIKAGNCLGDSLKAHDIFPPMIVQLAVSGEQVGELSQMLTKGADFLDKDIAGAINSLVAKLGPAITVIMGLIIASVLMAVYLPIFDYMRHLQ